VLYSELQVGLITSEISSGENVE
ncbi:hypothetical protein A2U01_0062306, partial [Trifolium medium]|nr:hypothetical protein [Trifolium medium]